MSEFRWGIVGAGRVAASFVDGLRASATGRAVAVTSRTRDKALVFARQQSIPRVCAGIDELVADPTLDAVYVSTPPALHLEHALLCLRADKPVLVEKPFTVDGAQARQLAEVARDRGVFCMEALWTRFLPAVQRVRQLLTAGAIGEPRLYRGSFSIADRVDPAEFRFDPALGGGALLDRGVYPISLACDFFGPPTDVSSQVRVGETGVDEEVTLTLRHPSGLLGIVDASMRTFGPNDMLIMGTEGSLHLEAPVYRPYRLMLTRHPQRHDAGGPRILRRARQRIRRLQDTVQRLSPRAGALLSRRAESIAAHYAGNGYHYQADEVARCVRAGLVESPVMSLDASVAVMEVLDAARAGWPEQGRT